MSKFCTKCGTQLEDSDLFCLNCGTKQRSYTPKAPNPEYVNTAQNKSSSDILSAMTSKASKLPYKKIAVVALSVLAVVIVIALIATTASVAISVAGPGPEKVAANYQKAMLENDLEKAVGYLPYDFESASLDNYLINNEEEFFELFGAIYNEDINSFKQWYKSYEKFNDEFDEYVYGKYTVEITGTEITEEGMDRGSLYLYSIGMEEYGFNSDDVKDMATVKVSYRIDGESSDDESYEYIYLAKIKGSWKVLEVPSAFSLS